MASTAYKGTVFAFRVSLLVNFMYFKLLPCDPQGVPVANKMLSTLIFNILHHRHQELLECQTFSVHLLKFSIFSIFGNFTGFAIDW